MKETNDPLENKNQADEHTQAIEAHLSKFYDEDELTVFHEMVSPDIHLDVYFIQAEQHNFNILLTAGMSTIEMKLQEGIEDPEQYKFAELMLLIPKEIEIGDFQKADSKNGWIISMLKQTARFPHHYDTWLGIGHSIQADAELNAYHPDTKFVGAVVLPSVTFEEEFTLIQNGENLINIYSLFPLYENELKYKIEHGYNGLLDLLIEKDVEEIFEVDRKNLLE